MSSSLYRLGRLMVRRGRLVLAGWLAMLAFTGLLAATGGGQLQENLTIPGTESQAGIDVLDSRFPEVAGTTGQILFVAPPGERVRAHRDDVLPVLREVRRLDHVSVATDPFTADDDLSVAPDGRHALSVVQLDIGLEHVNPGLEAGLAAAVEALPEDSPLEVHLGGTLFTTTTVHVSVTEVAGLVVALVVLAVTFGSLLAAGMPILTAVLAVGVAMAGILGLASIADISASTPTLALMIGLAVGIDYALFIVSRHRSQLAAGLPVEESVAQAAATAGSAVVFAGATVLIALCGLVVARIPFLAVMGLAAAGAVAVAVLVALTAVPAMLGLAGERLRPRAGSTAARRERDATTGAGARWVALVTRLPWLTVVAVVAGLLLATLPARDLALALPDNGTAKRGTPERVTYDLVAEAFGPGFNAPLLVTVDIIGTTEPVRVMDRLAADLAAVDGVAAVALATPNRTADLGIVQLVPATGQSDPATADLVRDVRARAPALEERYGVSELRVTGHTAVAIDVSDRLSGALLPFALVVVGLSLLLLTVVFRSIAVPVKATIGYLLSVGAAFGAVAAVFEWGWLAEPLDVARTGPVISFLPILLMGVLFGLAMDYEVFLVSRMREEFVHTGDAARAITTGFTANARVVTAAALIMTSVFAAFVPDSDAVVKPIAFGLAVGVLVDAFLVRMTLVPAVLALLGDRAWWLPRWLDRRLPVLDVEGAALQEQLAHRSWVVEHGPVAVRAEAVRLEDEDGAPVLAGVDLHARPGELLVVQSTDRVARRALLATLTGRLEHSRGTLVVLDRVLPAEAAAVRRRVPLFEQFPRLDELERAGGLVVVDDVDVFTSADELAARWAALRAAAARGAAVVAGAAAAPAGEPGADHLVPLGAAAGATPPGTGQSGHAHPTQEASL